MKLNNIVKVFVIPCEEVTEVVRLSRTTAKMNTTSEFRLLENIKYPCQLTISEKNNDKCSEYTTKLVIKTCDDWIDEGRKAFLCETADGEDYLIGTCDRPYPTQTIEQRHPEKGSDSQLTEVTIQYVSSKIPPIIVA
jgi:hypothetical protein